MKKTMSGFALGGLMVFLFATTALVATYDFSGEWGFATFLHESEEGCPEVDETSGLITISQDGQTFSLTIDRGFDCSPAWICEFEGFISADDWYLGYTSGDLDEPGETGTATLDFQADTSTSASGQIIYTYILEDATTCSWGFDFELEPPEAPEDDTETDTSDNTHALDH